MSRSGTGLVLTLLLAATLGVFAGSALAADKPLDAKLKSFEGDKVRLSDLRGEPVLLELWASWCLPCHEQSAILHTLADEIAAAGVTAYAVNVGEDADIVRKHLEQHPAAFPVLLDRHQAIPTQLKLAELPALVLLDAEGRVVGTTLGVAKDDAVRELLALAGGS